MFDSTPFLPFYSKPLHAEHAALLADGFAMYWHRREYRLPDPLPLSGKLKYGETEIRFAVFETENGEPCIDFYATKISIPQVHARVCLNRKAEELPLYRELISIRIRRFNEKTLQALEQYNQIVHEILLGKGFIDE
jgi:hypothetical protein